MVFSVGCSWDYAGEIMTWLGFVVDSVTGGSKNCFSLPVLRGTMRGKIMKWLFSDRTMLAKKMLEIVVASVKGGSKNGYELAWVCCGFCNRWQRKWLLFASSSWGYAGEKKM